MIKLATNSKRDLPASIFWVLGFDIVVSNVGKDYSWASCSWIGNIAITVAFQFGDVGAVNEVSWSQWIHIGQRWEAWVLSPASKCMLEWVGNCINRGNRGRITGVNPQELPSWQWRWKRKLHCPYLILRWKKLRKWALTVTYFSSGRPCQEGCICMWSSENSFQMLVLPTKSVPAIQFKSLGWKQVP